MKKANATPVASGSYAECLCRENAQLKSVISEILESTWVVKSPAYYKVLVESRTIDKAKELVE